MSNTNKGFTLIELLVVIGIIGILSGILYVVIDPQAQRNKAKDAVIKETMRKIYLEINSFYSTNLTYPSIAQLPMLLGSNVDIGNRGRTNCLHFEGIETSYGSTTCDTDTTKRFFYNYGYTPPLYFYQRIL